MLTSLSLIFLVGLAMGAICGYLKLPRIIGMLVTGIVLGPYVLDLLDPSILSISADLRKMALIIILLKAGLSLNLEDLKKVGRPAVMMSFVPASFEILGYILCAPAILGISRVDAAVMGAVLGAVSPAVVVPRMVKLIETKYGTGKAIPQMILAGASCDDIFVIVLFTTFLGMAQGDKAIVMLPGPPKEMKAVLAECCHLFINRLSDQVFVSINIKCKGPDELPLREIGEAPVADLLGDILDNENPTVATYAKEDGVLIRVTASGKTREDALTAMQPVVTKIAEILAGKIAWVKEEV